MTVVFTKYKKKSGLGDIFACLPLLITAESDKHIFFLIIYSQNKLLPYGLMAIFICTEFINTTESKTTYFSILWMYIYYNFQFYLLQHQPRVLYGYILSYA